ncbi:transporter [Salinisphaera sp. USBA-960]|nr:transporter [Salifodinibacter halophilus]NNC25795.1 transporter [Salifodinibacter halophilus]
MFKTHNAWFRSSVIAFILLGAVGASAATSNDPPSHQSISDVPFTGPLVASNATALPAGHWNIEPYLVDAIQYGKYNDNWHQRDTSDTHAFRSVTLFSYGVTDRLTVGVLPQFGFNQVSGAPSSDGVRLGDMTLRAHYMFHKFHKGSKIPTMALAVSESIPTGQYDGLDKVSNGLGSGVWSTKIGFWTQDYFWMPNGHILRARFNISYEFPNDNKVSVNGRSIYGTDPGFSGSFNPANTFTANASVEYSLTRHWAPALEILYSYTGSGRISGTAHNISSNQGLPHTTVREDTRSSEHFEVNPAVEYLFNKRYGLIVGAQITVAGRNTGAVVTPQAALNMFF